MFHYLKKLIQSKPEKMISYAQYIAEALYHPEHGYYMREGEKIGRNGDFITTSNISDIYGRAIAKWYRKLVQEYDLPSSVCEIGAGNGRFAMAFLKEWHREHHLPLRYFIVETSPYHLKKQRDLVTNFPNVKQIYNFEEIKPFKGMVFSNELFDALPVHVIERNEGMLYEIMIAVENNELIEKKVPLDNEQILCFIKKNKIVLNENQRIEIPLEMERMLARISNMMEKGLVVTADYGYTTDEWMEPHRRDGSLRGYYKHKMFHDVLKHPGKMDITSHVHFDALKREGEELGLRFLIKQRQDEFLLSIGLLKELEENYDPNPFSETSKRNRAIRSLILPDGMSGSFHIMIQQKNLHIYPNQLFQFNKKSNG
ncbi:SAM-dependent methyltransferase [Bacillus methanolicus]|uniref:class I SAM-dependent methyltransferase n=1 Tax=Bacillus methanolicus TaxID=1471 RepID=UPI00200DD156|nr:SAM-dependent methyltransferase [Bacillus methanolicus]UQD52733.1 SAM-dependent methyltransferase [Bacillus methanolicus]